jgi:hypothetical protein
MSDQINFDTKSSQKFFFRRLGNKLVTGMNHQNASVILYELQTLFRGATGIPLSIVAGSKL